MAEGHAATERLNARKAIAGAALLQGLTQRDALVEAGYSPATARTPPQNLRASACIDELKKIDPDAIPAKLLGLTRTRLLEHLNSVKGSELRTGEIARLVDVTERAYGSGEPLDALDDLRGYRERQSFAEELARRVASKIRQPVATRTQLSPDESAIEAEVVDVTPREDEEKSGTASDDEASVR